MAAGVSTQGWPSKSELNRRTRRLQRLLASDGLDGALMLQNVDLIYLAGTTQAEAVFVPRQGAPLVLARPPLDRLNAECPLPDQDVMPPWPQLRARLEQHTGRNIGRLGLELDVLPVAFYRKLTEKALAGLEIADASPLIRQTRAVKSKFELARMNRAAREIDHVFRAIPRLLKPGRTELQVEAGLMARARARGHQGLIRTRGFNQEIYFGHLLSGPNGLVPAKVNSPTGGQGVGPGLGQGAGPRVIGPDELVSADLCGTSGGYIVDQTRLYFTGRAPDRLRRASNGLNELMDRLADFIRPGITGGQIYEQAFKTASALGLEQGFMGLGRDICPFVGHGIGLELDEWPILARGVGQVLEKDMTFALEPRIFMPEFGVVGIEDTFHLTEDGPVPLNLTPRGLCEVET